MKKRIWQYLSTLIILTAIFGALSNFAYAQDTIPVGLGQPCPDGYIKIGAPPPGEALHYEDLCIRQAEALPIYINMIYTLSITLSIILATIMIIYGGYKYMTSSGNPETLAEAKDIITGAIIGLVLLILAALILRTISPSIAG